MWGIKTEARSACVLGGTDEERQRLQEGHYQKQVEKEVIATIISPSRNCHDFTTSSESPLLLLRLHNSGRMQEEVIK